MAAACRGALLLLLLLRLWVAQAQSAAAQLKAVATTLDYSAWASEVSTEALEATGGDAMSGRYGAKFVHLEGGGLLLHGGRAGDSAGDELSDVWILEPQTDGSLVWKTVTVSGSKEPSDSNGPFPAVVSSQGGMLVLIASGGMTMMMEMYHLVVTNYAGSWVQLPLESMSMARTAFSMCTYNGGDGLLVFGGVEYGNMLTESLYRIEVDWINSMANAVGQYYNTGNVWPSGRKFPAMVPYGSGKVLLGFGYDDVGQNNINRGDAFLLQLVDVNGILEPQFQQVSFSTEPQPSTRRDSAFLRTADGLLMAGGTDGNGNAFSDIWTLHVKEFADGPTGTWKIYQHGVGMNGAPAPAPMPYGAVIMPHGSGIVQALGRQGANLEPAAKLQYARPPPTTITKTTSTGTQTQTSSTLTATTTVTTTATTTGTTTATTTTGTTSTTMMIVATAAPRTAAQELEEAAAPTAAAATTALGGTVVLSAASSAASGTAVSMSAASAGGTATATAGTSASAAGGSGGGGAGMTKGLGQVGSAAKGLLKVASQQDQQKRSCLVTFLKRYGGSLALLAAAAVLIADAHRRGESIHLGVVFAGFAVMGMLLTFLACRDNCVARCMLSIRRCGDAISRRFWPCVGLIVSVLSAAAVLMTRFGEWVPVFNSCCLILAAFASFCNLRFPCRDRKFTVALAICVVSALVTVATTCRALAMALAPDEMAVMTGAIAVSKLAAGSDPPAAEEAAAGLKGEREESSADAAGLDDDSDGLMGLWATMALPGCAEPCTFDHKALEAAPLTGTELQAREFAERFERMWHEKPGSLARELTERLREPDERLPKRAVAMSLKHCAFLSELCFRKFGMHFDEGIEHIPVVLLCFYTYSMQDVDIDRLLNFQDVPEFPEGKETPAERDAHYREYRDGVLKTRNPQMFQVANWAARASWDAFVKDEENEESLGVLRDYCRWIACISAFSHTLKPAMECTRGLCGLPPFLIEKFSAMKKGDCIFWPSLSSVTADPHVSGSYANQCEPLDRNVIFTISNITEGLEMYKMSYYPKEQEILLPALSMLRVKKVIPGVPLKVFCTFEGSLQTESFRRSVLSDLQDASVELLEHLKAKDLKRMNSLVSEGSMVSEQSVRSSGPAKAVLHKEIGKIKAAMLVARLRAGEAARRGSARASEVLFGRPEGGELKEDDADTAETEVPANELAGSEGPGSEAAAAAQAPMAAASSSERPAEPEAPAVASLVSEGQAAKAKRPKAADLSSRSHQRLGTMSSIRSEAEVADAVGKLQSKASSPGGVTSLSSLQSEKVKVKKSHGKSKDPQGKSGRKAKPDKEEGMGAKSSVQSLKSSKGSA